jgi:3-hydroxyacyl-CoA dehydrogenase/enoyl-CoA hydratase/3-hydroxybutyryl-CoA epimerase/enoyl-CoA isomerase
MRFAGQSFQCSMLEGGVAELRLDLQGESVNKFNAPTLAELAEVVALLQTTPEVLGLLLISGKESGFVVGADVTEFPGHFQRSEAQLVDWICSVHRLFSAIEDFAFPTVAAIHGVALGGGLELALTTSYRVMASSAKIGFPETRLGIFPGWGGTVRMSRLAGAPKAIEWMVAGDTHGAEESLKLGMADLVVAPEQLREGALDLLGQAMAGKLDWKARRQLKVDPLRLDAAECDKLFEGAKATVSAKSGPNYPAPLAAVETLQQGVALGRDAALAIEAQAFARIARTPTAFALVSNFLGDQYVGKLAKKLAKTGTRVESAAVLGAGIMGGGIAYQSASRGTPILMKDIDEKALALGLSEASKLLAKGVEKGSLSPAGSAEILARIHPTLNFADFGTVDLVVEAVTENEKIKTAVLLDLERQVKADAILASNTSTISITRLAEGLQRPENFCGIHFFNPVPRMPLVEVIRGRRTGERAVASAVGYALALGKTPIVVNDCPGFLVNRILFPYFSAFSMLVNEGVDFQRIDRVMEQFGWPMGPAYLLDVVGIDTAWRADQVMAQGFPDRMASPVKTAIQAMFEAGRFGQKNGRGFYQYVPDAKGVPRKQADPISAGILGPLVQKDNSAAITDQDIVDRMLLPMIIEGSRCLEDGIVASPVEVDMGLLYGLGFPPFRSGALAYADRVGLKALGAKAERFRSLGRLYEPTAQMLRLAEVDGTFHGAR